MTIITYHIYHESDVAVSECRHYVTLFQFSEAVRAIWPPYMLSNELLKQLSNTLTTV